MAGLEKEPIRRIELVPKCVECDAVWLPADEDRRQLHQVDVDELAWYCPACAVREFGGD
jgi:hypothetical protein